MHEVYVNITVPNPKAAAQVQPFIQRYGQPMQATYLDWIINPLVDRTSTRATKFSFIIYSAEMAGALWDYATSYCKAPRQLAALERLKEIGDDLSGKGLVTPETLLKEMGWLIDIVNLVSQNTDAQNAAAVVALYHEHGDSLGIARRMGPSKRIRVKTLLERHGLIERA